MPESLASEALVELRNLKVYFPIHSGVFRKKTGDIKAVDDVSLDIFAGETLGLVGESGCGKTTAGRAILRLSDITGGTIKIEGTDLASARSSEIRRIRPKMQMIFQDPQASLNPRMTVSAIISEPIDEHLSLSKAEKFERVFEIMDSVG